MPLKLEAIFFKTKWSVQIYNKTLFNIKSYISATNLSWANLQIQAFWTPVIQPRREEPRDEVANNRQISMRKQIVASEIIS